MEKRWGIAVSVLLLDLKRCKFPLSLVSRARLRSLASGAALVLDLLAYPSNLMHRLGPLGATWLVGPQLAGSEFPAAVRAWALHFRPAAAVLTEDASRQMSTKVAGSQHLAAEGAERRNRRSADGIAYGIQLSGHTMCNHCTRNCTLVCTNPGTRCRACSVSSYGTSQ